jgi:hypothetical protein
MRMSRKRFVQLSETPFESSACTIGPTMVHKHKNKKNKRKVGRHQVLEHMLHRSSESILFYKSVSKSILKQNKTDIPLYADCHCFSATTFITGATVLVARVVIFVIFRQWGNVQGAANHQTSNMKSTHLHSISLCDSSGSS